METDPKKMTGEQLAEILSGAYQQLNMAQGNIMAINQELERRKKETAESKDVKK